MEIIYLPKADEDLMHWIKSGQKNILKKIALITSDILEHPYTGIAKPEALKYNLTNYWSRRITQEHRYVYKIENEILYVFSLKGHYE
jgi:toxin YoeB